MKLIDVNMIGPSLHNRSYTLVEKIGSGESGTVYKAFRRPDGQKIPEHYQNQPLALKLYHAPDTSLRSRPFLPEITAMMRLHYSDYVVQFLDRSSPHDPLKYTVMEYVPETITRHLQWALDNDTTLSEEVVRTYLRDIPKVLAMLWSQKTVHCDIRDTNVGIKYDRLKLLDFGYARPFLQHFPTALPTARPFYPPELREEGKVMPTLDTYCAGKLLELMLLGDYASDAEEALEMMEFVYTVSIPVSFKRLLTAMTHANPLRRPDPGSLEELMKKALVDITNAGCFKPQAVAPLHTAKLYPTSSSFLG